MSRVVDKRDVTVDLPDEVLCHVFSFLSLKDKLRPEAVNHKFQRCVLKELKEKPQPLELQLDTTSNDLNGFKVPPELIFGAVQSLAKRIIFNNVLIHFELGEFSHFHARSHQHVVGCMEQLDGILSLLISEPQSLSKVTTFVSNCGCSQAVLQSFLDKCDKHSTIKLEFKVRPLTCEPNGYTTFALDLGELLKNRALTGLKLRLFCYQQYQKALTDIFRTNALRRVDLGFDFMIDILNPVEVVDELNRCAGSTLEEIRLRLPNAVPFPALFESLARLPALLKCHMDFSSLETEDQFVPAVASLFTIMSHIKISTTVVFHKFMFFTNISGCQLINLIRPIQNVHPRMLVDYDRVSLTLSLGNATVRKLFLDTGVEVCDAEDCVQCQSFYPSMLYFLRSQAQNAAREFVEAQQLPNCRLDRCRVGRFLDDLNAQFFYSYWRALSVETNEDQQSITINFETQKMEHHLFSITIFYGRCLSGCMKCIMLPE